MRRKHVTVALVAWLLAGFCVGDAWAGDEVDYSAPYLTLEDGKLVTKYPAREHEPGTAAAAAAEPVGVSAANDSSPQPTAAGKYWVFAAAGIGLILGVLLLVRRGRHREARTADSSD